LSFLCALPSPKPAIPGHHASAPAEEHPPVSESRRRKRKCGDYTFAPVVGFPRSPHASTVCPCLPSPHPPAGY
ncbi:uncharacterized protein PHACADRAFT_167651, partial [Phanerochaete carnosa HHB-10118-sp]